MTTTLLTPATTSRVTSPAPLTLRLLESNEVEAAFACWRELAQRVGPVPLMASELWTKTWLAHYGDTVRFQFLIGEMSGIPRGIVLVTESSHRKAPGLTVHIRHLGTAGEPVHEGAVVEYNSLIVEPTCRNAFIDAVSRWMLRQAGGDLIQLDGFTEAEAAELSAQWPAVETRARESKYLDLAAIRHAGGELIQALGSSTRSNLRRKLRDYGDIQGEWAESLDVAENIFEELIELHQARWIAAGQPGAFASQRFTAFQRSLLKALFPRGECVLFRVRHQGTTVGCLLLLNDRGRLLDYLSGLADFSQKPSPGLVSHYLCECEALKRGHVAYDFLVGDKRHKDNLSTHTQILTWTQFARPNFKNRLVAALTQVKRRLLSISGKSPPDKNTASSAMPEKESP